MCWAANLKNIKTSGLQYSVLVHADYFTAHIIPAVLWTPLAAAPTRTGAHFKIKIDCFAPVISFPNLVLFITCMVLDLDIYLFIASGELSGKSYNTAPSLWKQAGDDCDRIYVWGTFSLKIVAELQAPQFFLPSSNFKIMRLCESNKKTENSRKCWKTFWSLPRKMPGSRHQSQPSEALRGLRVGYTLDQQVVYRDHIDKHLFTFTHSHTNTHTCGQFEVTN